jgi:uncharacterized protein (TIGR02001 family)
MKRITLVVLIAALAVVGAMPAAAQDEGDFSFTLDTTFVSKYLWRGFVLNDSPSMQPAVGFGYKGLSVSSWSNFSHVTPRGQKWTEHDLTVDYSHSFDKLGVSVGYIWYAFPDVPSGMGNRSHELYAGVSYDTILQPSFTYYRDVDQGDGNYFYLGIGHSQDLGKGVALNLNTGLGVNNGMWIDVTTVSNWDLTASVDIPWGSKVVFSPFFTQMIGQKDLFGNHNMFGVNLSVIDLTW